MVIFTMKVKITLNWAAKLNLNQWKFIEPISRMTSLNPEYFWYFAFRVSLFWKFWKYHLEINFAWFTSQSWFYPESEIILKIKTCLFFNFEIFQNFLKCQKLGKNPTVQFTRHTTHSESLKLNCRLSQATL